MATPENPYAGQGAVLLDIGGDVGALVVAMPASTVGLEVELRPAGVTAGRTYHHDHQHHDHQHHDDHDPGGQGAAAAWGSGSTAYPHVAVVARPGRSGPLHTLVYADVRAGDYELVPLPDGEVALTVTVTGGAVTHAVWPD